MTGARMLAAAVAAALLAVPVPAIAQQRDCAEPGEDYAPVPWAQRALGPDRVWPFTQGGGVTVAVLSSGVDASHPQLAGRVLGGFDAFADTGTADDDCLGLGTQVAGVIAGQPSGSAGFTGVAPGARILPVRVVEVAGFGGAEVEPAVLARAIGWAADRADVIDIAVASYTDDPDLRAAVEDAVADGVIVVAAAGDLGDESSGNPTPYPAAYDGVLGVGAVDPEGNRWSGSPGGDYIDLVAPGVAVVTLQRREGMIDVTGTGVASGFVAAAAALVRAAAPDEPAGEVVRRLLATATPAPLGPDHPEYGRGVVNPYAAVNDRLVEVSPAPLPELARPRPDEQPAWARARELAVTGALVAATGFVAVIAVAVALPAGRRRFWRPAVAAPPPADREPAEPGPPLSLFDER